MNKGTFDEIDVYRMTYFIKLLQKTSSFKLKEERFIQRIGLMSIGVSLVIIMLIMTLFILYADQKRQRDLIGDGLTLTNMVAGYSLHELKKDNAHKLLEIVNYTGSKSGLVYSVIMDAHENIVAHTGSGYEDNGVIAKRAASSNNPLRQNYKDRRTNNTIYEFSRPIYNSGKKEGIVRLGFSPEINPLFSDSEIRGILLVATLFFSLVPIFYYLVRGSLRLHTLSITDELTGLYNRRGFFTLAEDHLMSAKRSEKGLLLLYADLDNLKEINDTLGHDEGDRLIKETAEILKSTYRTSDIIARIGGDEFVAFPVGSDEDHVAIIANRLQKNIENFNAENNNRYKLRISTGIAMYDPSSVESINELLAQADELMYEHKKSKKKGHNETPHAKSSYCPG
jgi:diguanylate cyclase (GGDEF)-like protein